MEQSARMAILCVSEGATSDEWCVRVDVCVVVAKGCCEVPVAVERIIKWYNMNAFKRDKKEEEEGMYQTHGIYHWRFFWKFKFWIMS
jgi:hypothetical protein